MKGNNPYHRYTGEMQIKEKNNQVRRNIENTQVENKEKREENELRRKKKREKAKNEAKARGFENIKNKRK